MILFYKYIIHIYKYIIDNLKSEMQCLSNTKNNNCAISKSCVYKNICEEPTYKIMAL